MYKNSILASICSIFSYILLIGGMIVAGTKDLRLGIWMVVLGVTLSIAAPIISENKKFKSWKQQVKSQGLASMIASSDQFAVDIYNTYPCKKALEYIRTLNPEAARSIENQNNSN
jgi:hypothetical protein